MNFTSLDHGRRGQNHEVYQTLKAGKSKNIYKEMKMNIDPSDIEIKIKLLKSETTLAQVTLILFGVWVEKGWRVSKSKNEHPVYHDFVWVQPPCYSTGFGKWQEIVYIDDRRLYEDVHAKILDAYYRERNKEDTIGEIDEINPKEVDKANE